MTGFARSEGRLEACAWSWEVKSVNGKGIDVRVRMAGGFDDLETRVKALVTNRFRRGNLALSLDFEWTASRTRLSLNETVLDEISGLIDTLKARFGDLRPSNADGLLAVKGLLETTESEIDDDTRRKAETAVLVSLDEALSRLTEMRAEEGEKLATVLHGQLDRIARLHHEACALESVQPERIRERLSRQVAALCADATDIPPERLAQEAAILMTKADVREELDRLAAHLQGARSLLGEDGAIGRRLDFLCQEFNREANTLCSKSSDVALTRVGLELKATIEQFREQVQNIE